jgi:hypothetical protein
LLGFAPSAPSDVRDQLMTRSASILQQRRDHDAKGLGNINAHHQVSVKSQDATRIVACHDGDLPSVARLAQ